MNSQNYPWIDRVKYLVSFLVLVIHFRPFSDYHRNIDFASIHIVARIAVPFFFISSGYFIGVNGLEKSKVLKSIKKNLKLYLVWTILYLPIFILIFMPQYPNLLIDFTVLGVYYHLWFMPALIFSLIILYYLNKFLKPTSITFIAFLFFVIGVFGDSYYGVLPNGWFLDIMNNYLDIFSTTRNGLFFGLLFVSIGYLIRKSEIHTRISVRNTWIGFIIGYLLMFVEMGLLMKYTVPFEYNMYFSIIPTTFFLFCLCLNYPSDEKSIDLRNKATLIYFSHFIVYFIVYGLITILKLDFLLQSSLIRYFIAVISSVLFANFVIKQKKKNKKWANYLV
jgi:serine/alanine racemase